MTSPASTTTAVVQTASPAPVVPSNQPSHGSWPVVLLVAAFLLAGVGTMVLAHRRSQSPEE
ncbi:MAG TPA: hypothetical protein VM097_03965 [Mycobacteriales bacterium]|nr:hypothetical protein [Mycobacteriales bacterium]